MTEATGADLGPELADAVARAAADRQPLYIGAGGSKRRLLGRDCEAPLLDVSGHRGIVDYEPGELVLTARAGTPLTELQAALAAQGQTLPFEPPLFGGRATLGGTVACNSSGPARPWGGAVRDLVLGVQLINGRGELLNFGGRVMKNVAGYDVSRLQAGALGTLGVLTRVSLKVLPAPERNLTLVYELDAAAAVMVMNRRAGEPRPLSGACWVDGRLYLRLSGPGGALAHTARQWGGEVLDGADDFWRDLRELALPFFDGDAPLWRCSLRPTAPVDLLPGPALIDWAGALRWVRGAHRLEQLQRAAAGAGGHVTLFRGGDRRGAVLPRPDPVSAGLQRRLKLAFDPLGILNPGRLQPEPGED